MAPTSMFHQHFEDERSSCCHSLAKNLDLPTISLLPSSVNTLYSLFYVFLKVIIAKIIVSFTTYKCHCGKQ